MGCLYMIIAEQDNASCVLIGIAMASLPLYRYQATKVF